MNRKVFAFGGVDLLVNRNEVLEFTEGVGWRRRANLPVGSHKENKVLYVREFPKPPCIK